MRSPGIEPGSITWQATIITTRPRTLHDVVEQNMTSFTLWFCHDYIQLAFIGDRLSSSQTIPLN